jgi:hypothetical protein
LRIAILVEPADLLLINVADVAAFGNVTTSAVADLSGFANFSLVILI